MRPPQCGLAHLAAAVNATLDLCDLMVREMPATTAVGGAEPFDVEAAIQARARLMEAAIQARRIVAELNEHLYYCEECETP